MKWTNKNNLPTPFAESLTESVAEIVESLWEHMSGYCEHQVYSDDDSEVFCNDVDNETRECSYNACPVVTDWDSYIERKKAKQSKTKRDKEGK